MLPKLSPLALGLLFLSAAHATGQDNKPYDGPACSRVVDDYFVREVWPKVAALSCVNCHKAGGDAEGSRLVLRDPRKEQDHAQDEAINHNREIFAKIARIKEGDQSRLLLKATGGLKHGGTDVLKSDS